jgi:hypothetical protein
MGQLKGLDAGCINPLAWRFLTISALRWTLQRKD